jgi:nucleotide sugar dehydrogenase
MAAVDAINKGKNPIQGEPGLDELVAKTVKAGRLRATANPLDVSGFDIFIILVPTHVKPNAAGDSFEADMGIVNTVTKWIGAALKPGGIVITECTMPPGATMALVPALEKGSGLKAGKDFGVAHAPERTMSGTAIRDIRGQYPKILGALDDKTFAPLHAIYSALDAKGVLRASSVTTAECVKVFEGTYRDVNIALANELARYSMAKGVNALEAFKLANTVPFYNLHAPGIGVGGHCIPYYPYFVMTPDTPVIKAARKTNDQMVAFAVDMLERALAERKVKLAGAKIAVLGLAFRGGVKEFAHSPGLAALAELKKRGATVLAWEPLCSDEEVKKFGATPVHSLAGASGAIVAADHSLFKELDWAAQAKSMAVPVIVEGRQVVSEAHRAAMAKTGAALRTIGRP